MLALSKKIKQQPAHTKNQNVVAKDIIAACNWGFLVLPSLLLVLPPPNTPKKVPNVCGVYWQKP